MSTKVIELANDDDAQAFIETITKSSSKLFESLTKFRGGGGPQLIDKLKARLGNDNVQGLAAVADHRPEYAWTGVVPGTGKAAQHPAQRRPVWLLRSPQRLTQKKDMPMLAGHLQLLTGPERIHSGWWDGQAVNRDYYVARQPSGRQLWIYRDRSDGVWYLHGVFGV